MYIFISTTLLLTISCCLWTTEGRQYKAIISVPNGGPWGEWGSPIFCSYGYVIGFRAKASLIEKGIDNTALDGIGLICQDYTFLRGSFGLWGKWYHDKYCPSGFLIAFSLGVQKYQGTGDDTAVNAFKFKCSDGTIMEGNAEHWRDFGPWSHSCHPHSYVCGIQTKLESYQWAGDDTTLNDVRLYCC